MPAKTNTERYSLDNQLAAKRRDLYEAQAEHARQSLALSENPDNTAQQAAVEAIEAEIAGLEKQIARLEAAQVARAKQAKVDRSAELKVEHSRRVARLKSRDAEIRAVTAELVERIEELAPLVARLDQANAEHATTLREALKEAFPFTERNSRFQQNNPMNARIAPSVAVRHALNRAGLYSSSVLALPVGGHIGATDDSRRLFEKHDDALQVVMDEVGERILERERSAR